MHLSITPTIALLAAPVFCCSLANSASAQQKETIEIDVLVAYTEAAARWADSPRYDDGAHQPQGPFGCDFLQESHRGILRYGDASDGISVATPFADAAVRLATDWGIHHPCETLTERRYDSDVGINRLIDIAIAELNDIYARMDSDTVDVIFNKVGSYKVELTSTTTGTRHAYREFLYNDFYAADTVFGALARLQIPDADEVTNLATLGVRGVCDAQTGCDTTFWPGDTTNALALDSIHYQRLKSKADLVILITDAPRNVIEGSPFANDGLIHSSIGEARVAGVTSAQNGFAWVSVRHATAPLYTFAHEISHLMGANHYELNRLGDMQVQPNLVKPDVNDNGQEDNLGSIEEHNGCYYGTLMSESSACPLFFDQELAGENTETVDNVCRSARVNLQTAHYAFENFIVVPKLSDGTVGKRRNNRRVVTNIKRLKTIARFDEELAGLCRNFIANDKIGFDFGARFSNLAYSITTSHRKVSGFVGLHSDSDVGRFREEKWFNVTSIAAGATEIEDDAPVHVEVVGRFFGKRAVALGVQALLASGLADMPESAMRDGFDVTPGWGTSSAPSALRLSGLDSRLRYHIRLFSSSDTLNEPRRLRVTVNQRTREIHTSGNVASFLDLSEVAPESDGTILLEFSGSPRNRHVLLNALQIYPEERDPDGVCEL